MMAFSGNLDIGDQPLTPERGEEITNILKVAGCTARLSVH